MNSCVVGNIVGNGVCVRLTVVILPQASSGFVIQGKVPINVHW